MKEAQTRASNVNTWSCQFQTALFTILFATIWIPCSSAAPPPPHGVVAGNINVVINSFDNTSNAVSLSLPLRIGDFRLGPEESNNGDYNVQIGSSRTNDFLEGVLISSVRENGRDDGNPVYLGTNSCTSHIDYHKLGATNFAGELIQYGYWIPITMTWPNSISTSVIEYDVNVAAAWFPYSNWVGGFAHYSNPSDNNTTLDAFIGSPGLSLGTNFIDLGNAQYVVDLKPKGFDSRTDGVLLVMGAKNEDNYALSSVNSTNGTWTIYSKDNGTDGTAGEQDPVAFVFVAKTNTTVVSGRFRSDATIDIFSGASPQFTISNVDVGTWELKIPGRSPAYGVLIISPEGGLPGNRDNIVSYQVNNAADGWIIQSRDLPATNSPYEAPLESPGTNDPVASFVFIPGATPGFTVTPTNNLVTSESGDQDSFTVVLDSPPSADVTIAVSSSDTTEGTVSTSSLTFSTGNWDAPQNVTVTGVNDALSDGTIAYTIVLGPATSTDLAYNGINPPDVSVANTDNESGITVAPTSGLITTEAGGTNSFNIHLNTQPTADVTINLSSSDTTEGTVSPSSVTFNSGNWNVDQLVTITGVNDAVDDGDVAYTIITAASTSSDPNYNGLNPADVSALNQDNDTAGATVSAAGPIGLQVVEAKTNSYTVVLNSEPAANVTVNVTSSNTGQGGTVSPASLAFTPANWNTPQPVTITGADDLLLDGNTAWRITNSISSSDPLYAVIQPITVTMLTLDNEASLTLPSGDLIYGTGQAGIGLDGRATIVDTNTPNYTSGTLTVSITANGTADDRLEIRNTGTGAGQISVSGNTISYGGTPIGTFTGGTGTTPVVISFNSSATPAAAEALLRNITFRNVSANPSTARRTVSVSLAHADGGISVAMIGVRVGLLRAIQFQQGADYGYGPYSGAADIHLRQAAPDTAHPTGGGSGLFIDWPDANNAFHVLLRFDNIIGNAFAQIPSNAVIVSAELILDVNDSGDASPLYRMLIPWNAETETWNTLGNGVDQDDVESRSAFDSQFGLSNGDANTSIGTISLAVTPDVQAWVNSVDPNYGWAMPGWSAQTDGTGFSPSEAPVINDRPRLRVLWLPQGSASAASFRQDVDGYTGVRDTRIRFNAPDTEFSTVTGAFVDWAVSASDDNEHVLIRFNDIIGSGTNQVPSGSQIHAAVLDLASVIGNAMGDGGNFHAMLQSWEDTNTWNMFVNGVVADGIEAVTTPSATAGNSTLNPNVQAAFLTFELTPDVQAWVSGTRPNYGWAILPWPNGGDGWGFGMSEQATERNRPRLRVYFTPGTPTSNIVLLTPIWTPTNVQIRFTATIGENYQIHRAPTVTGPWTTNGTATVQPDGIGTFNDTSAPAGSAFYRVYHP